MAIRRICLCVFNRATYSRCKSLIEALSQRPEIDLTVLLSGGVAMEEYGNARRYIQEDFKETKVRFHHIDIAYRDSTPSGMVQASAEIVAKYGSYFADRPYSAVIFVADRFETLPAALAASYQNIPIIHIQGGEITGNIDEKVRHAVTMLSDYHFVSTDLAKAYLNRMGQGIAGNRGRVFKTGCPSLDLIKENKIRRKITKQRYIICFFHPETENLSEAAEQTNSLLNAVLAYCKEHATTCYWQWPNPDPGRMAITDILDTASRRNPDYIRKEVNLRPELFLRRLSQARFLVGNSSCGIRECSFLGVPAVNVGERQRYRERASNVIDCSHSYTDILGAMNYAHKAKSTKRSMLYGDGNAAKAIADRIALFDGLTLKESLQFPHTIDFKFAHKIVSRPEQLGELTQ